MKKRNIFSIVLVFVLCLTVMLSLVGCKDKDKKPDDKTPAGPVGPAGPGEEIPVEKDINDIIYDEALGEFNNFYQKALAENKDLDKRYALMAIAEAKFLESAVFLPTTCNGGAYGIRCVAPHCVTTASWGMDQYRTPDLIVSDKPIVKEDVEAMRNKWGEMLEDPSKSGKDYLDWVESEYFADGKSYQHRKTEGELSYSRFYGTEVKTWDALATYRQSDSEPIGNGWEGLLAYDCLDRLNPGLAEAMPEVSEDGLTYTFKLRKGMQWVNSKGERIGEITADDFVAGMQHLLDCQGGLEGLMVGLIKGADGYLGGDFDFSKVGVKQGKDKYELIYTLEQPAPYFVTMLGYNPFCPLCRSFYESKGGKFGEEYGSMATTTEIDPKTNKEVTKYVDYFYGSSFENIAYCGPFRVAQHTNESKMVFVKNDQYWDKDNVKLDVINWTYNDGKVPTKAYDETVAGHIDGCGLNPPSLEKARIDKTWDQEKSNFDKFAIVSETDDTAFGVWFNLHRGSYVNFNDNSTAPSPKSAVAGHRAKLAMRNVHFRRAIAFSLDRLVYNGALVGDDCKAYSVINSYVPGRFISMEKELKIEINGEEKTFPAGTFYGAIMQAQIDADGLKIKVWDPEADNRLGKSIGFDGWFNPEEANKELDKAIEELGLEITADNPIEIDIPYTTEIPDFELRAQIYKQSMEETLNHKVKVNLVSAGAYNNLLASGYFCDSGELCNYDLYDVSGWGPDYKDPKSYLDTMRPEDGDMIHCIGLW